MDAVGPSIAGQFGRGRSQFQQSAVVEPVELPVRRGGPDLVGHRLGKAAEAGLAEAKRLLALHPLGDVAADDHDGPHRAGCIPHGLGNKFDETPLERPIGTARQHGRHRGCLCRNARGVDPVEQLVEALPIELRESLAHRQTDQRPFADKGRIGGIAEFIAVFRAAGHRDEVRGVLEHGPQPLRFVQQPAIGGHLGGGLHHHSQHPARLRLVVQHRREIQVHPDLFGLTGLAVQRQLLVLVLQGAAGQAGAHHMLVEVDDFRPGIPHRDAQLRQLPSAGKSGVGVVVDHGAGLAP